MANSTIRGEKLNLKCWIDCMGRPKCSIPYLLSQCRVAFRRVRSRALPSSWPWSHCRRARSAWFGSAAASPPAACWWPAAGSGSAAAAECPGPAPKAAALGADFRHCWRRLLLHHRPWGGHQRAHPRCRCHPDRSPRRRGHWAASWRQQRPPPRTATGCSSAGRSDHSFPRPAGGHCCFPPKMKAGRSVLGMNRMKKKTKILTTLISVAGKSWKNCSSSKVFSDSWRSSSSESLQSDSSRLFKSQPFPVASVWWFITLVSCTRRDREAVWSCLMVLNGGCPPRNGSPQNYHFPESCRLVSLTICNHQLKWLGNFELVRWKRVRDDCFFFFFVKVFS